jgi:hypothetical protein
MPEPVAGYATPVPGSRHGLLRRRRAHYRAGLGLSTRENAGAFAFSIMITSAFGVVSSLESRPTAGDIFLFAAGAVGGFVGVLLLGRALAVPDTEARRTDVVLLASALSVFSVLAAVGAAGGISWAASGWVAWLVAPLAACATFLLVNGVEYAVAELEEDG